MDKLDKDFADRGSYQSTPLDVLKCALFQKETYKGYGPECRSYDDDYIKQMKDLFEKYKKTGDLSYNRIRESIKKKVTFLK